MNGVRGAWATFGFRGVHLTWRGGQCQINAIEINNEGNEQVSNNCSSILAALIFQCTIYESSNSAASCHFNHLFVNHNGMNSENLIQFRNSNGNVENLYRSENLRRNEQIYPYCKHQLIYEIEKISASRRGRTFEIRGDSAMYVVEKINRTNMLSGGWLANQQENEDE